jgi:alpha-amylase/alpha-mannosidase (GH57 family)
VDGSLTTWIGDPVKNRAWDLLTTARQVLADHPEATPENNPDAWAALYAAEGSDWFWWFGEGHSSNQDAMFDQLFREHLVALYQALNEPVPANLYHYVEDHHRRREQRPEGFIHPLIDGRGDEQDWNMAGKMEIGGARGTMHQSSTIQRVFYGVDHRNFYVRLDFKQGTKVGVDIPNELNLVWFYDKTMHNSLLPLAELPREEPLNYRYHHRLQVNLQTMNCWLQEAMDYDRWENRPCTARAAWDNCLEIAVPWEDLGIEPDYAMQMLLVFSDYGRFRSYLPETQSIPLQMP